ncbi:hypothetical protein D5272_00345 [bacterium D16-76]|nr:hypothetical protein [bacterium D16-76]
MSSSSSAIRPGINLRKKKNLLCWVVLYFSAFGANMQALSIPRAAAQAICPLQAWVGWPGHVPQGPRIYCTVPKKDGGPGAFGLTRLFCGAKPLTPCPWPVDGKASLWRENIEERNGTMGGLRP